MPGHVVAGHVVAGHVVVVGAGQAGVQFADSLRAAGHAGPVTIVEQEACLPYQRPPLSKDHLAENGDPQAVPLRGAAFYTDQDIVLRRGARVVAVDRARHRVRLDDGTALTYATLVLATGAANRVLDVPGRDLAGVHDLRTLGDADRLRDALRARESQAGAAVVVGAGFVGLEFAAVARARGLAVTVLEAARRPLGRAVSEEVSVHVAAVHRRMGTDLRLGESVRAIEGVDGRVTTVVGTTGTRHRADLVVVGIGAVPRDGIAAAAGLAADAGIVVDGALRTADPDVYAIGDCARFPSAHLGVPVRLESVQNAAEQARHLARTIVGGPPGPYASVPWFSSHQGPLRLQIAGLAAVDDERVVSGDADAGRFSVLHYRDGRLRAVESVDSPADHLAARRLLAQGRSPEPDEVTAPGFSLRGFARSAVSGGAAAV